MIDPPTGTEGDRVLARLLRGTRQDPALRREADTMGFCVALALIAAFMTGSDGAEHTQLGVLGIIWGTTVGLAVAHWFAMALSVRVVDDPSLHHSSLEMLVPQLLMAVGIAIVASVTVLVLSADLERAGARTIAAVFIAGLVGVEMRASGASRRSATGYGLLALFAGVSVAMVKWFISK